MQENQIIQQMRPKLSTVPGIKVVLQNPPAIRIGTRFTKGLYQFTLQHPDTRELYKYASEFEGKLKELALLQDVNSDLQLKNPQVNVEIERDRGSGLGVNLYQIEDALARGLCVKRSLNYICTE